MLNLSDLIIQHPEVNSFQHLVGVLRQRAEAGEILFRFDIKPDYRDTPRDWETQLENAFIWARKR
jgi:hypothetical protein